MIVKITLFVYGTLQSEQSNSHYCRNAISIEPATVCGKLYQLSAGYPALKVPNDSIIMAGIEDVFASAQAQYHENKAMDFEFKIHNNWDTIHGELVTFNDPAEMKPIDKLESIPFYYDRVLIPAQKADGSVITTWTYIMYDIHNLASYLPNGIWPENNKLEVNNE
jgi:gamma-glutamylcyclotransferase (GGCT)/AIG2-like uncharacterized protein YtfP